MHIARRPRKLLLGKHALQMARLLPKLPSDRAMPLPSPLQKLSLREPAMLNSRFKCSMHGLAERNVAQTRELYERSKNILRAVLESSEKSCEGAIALNRKIIDLAERNVSTVFDLAMSLAGAKNLAEVMNLQAAYWRKQFGNLSAQAEELRALSTKVATSVTEPIKAQVTHGTDA